MARVRWLPGAVTDLDDIWLSIAIESPRAADRIIDRLFGVERRLAQFPQIAVARNDLAPGLRALPMLDYLVLHRVDGEDVIVVRVIHGARDLGDLLAES